MIERAAAFVEADSGLLDEARASAHRSRIHAQAVSDGIHWSARVQRSATSSWSPATSRPPSLISVSSPPVSSAPDISHRPATRGWTPSRSSSGWASSTPRRSISIATENCRRSAFPAPGSVRLAPMGCCMRRAVTRTQQFGPCRSRWMPRSPGSIAWSAGGRCWRSAPSSDKPSSAARRGRRSRRRRGSSTRWARSRGRRRLAPSSAASAAGARPPTSSPTLERRVAELAADGRRNKEIAAAMYVTVATVEAHLSRVYRKLGVRSRAELAGRFSRDARDVDHSV